MRRAWSCFLHGSVLVAMAFSLSGCVLTPEFFACLASGSFASDGCAQDSISPGPPSAPIGVTAIVDRSGQSDVIVVDWALNHEPDLARYGIYRSTSSGGPYDRLVSIHVGTDGPPYTDSTATPCVTYYYAVTATDKVEQESPFSQEVAASACPLLHVAGLTANAGDGSVLLDWNDTFDLNLAGYNVYRQSDETEQRKLNAELLTISEYRDTGLTNGTLYTYRVAAVNTSGDEGASSTTAAVPTAADGKPAAPTGLTATHSGEDVFLDWNENGEADLAGYNVYESTQPAGPFGRLDSVTESEYLAVETPNIELFYYVTAVDEAGNESDPSATARAAPVALALLSRGPTASRPDHGWFPFELTITGDYREGGRSRVEGDRLVGDGFVYEGAFELTAASRLPAAGLGGTWRSTTDWVLDPGAGTGSATGVALATFADPEAGEACLRFEETYTVKKTSKGAQVATHGTFTLLGGTGDAAKLLGKGTHRVSVRSDGSVTYEGKARPVQSAVPGLPAECHALSAAPSNRRLSGSARRSGA